MADNKSKGFLEETVTKLWGGGIGLVGYASSDAARAIDSAGHAAYNATWSAFNEALGAGAFVGAALGAGWTLDQVPQLTDGLVGLSEVTHGVVSANTYKALLGGAAAFAYALKKVADTYHGK